MALMNCPECHREISDSVTVCPNCGYRLKKKGKAGLLALVALVVIVVAVCVYFFNVRPKQMLVRAENLIARERFGEAENILAELKDSEKKTELQTRITLYDVHKLLDSGDYEGAEKKLQTLPENIDPELEGEIALKRAEALAVQGKYEAAEEVLNGAGQTQEIQTMLEEISYESRIFSCIQSIKKYLKNPDSLSIYEVNFYPDRKAVESEDSKDEDADAAETDADGEEEETVFVDTEPACVMHYGAQNGFGGNTTNYALFRWDEESEAYSIQGVVDSLDEEDLDKSDDDYFYDFLIQMSINSYMEKTPVGTFNMERVQTLLKNNAYSAIKIIK